MSSVTTRSSGSDLVLTRRFQNSHRQLSVPTLSSSQSIARTKITFPSTAQIRITLLCLEQQWNRRKASPVSITKGQKPVSKRTRWRSWRSVLKSYKSRTNCYQPYSWRFKSSLRLSSTSNQTTSAWRRPWRPGTNTASKTNNAPTASTKCPQRHKQTSPSSNCSPTKLNWQSN